MRTEFLVLPSSYMMWRRCGMEAVMSLLYYRNALVIRLFIYRLCFGLFKHATQ